MIIKFMDFVKTASEGVTDWKEWTRRRGATAPCCPKCGWLREQTTGLGQQTLAPHCRYCGFKYLGW